MPLTVFESLIQSTMPETNVLMPSVTMRLSISSSTTKSPLTPDQQAAPSATRIARPIGTPWLTLRIAISMADRPTTEATDRS